MFYLIKIKGIVKKKVCTFHRGGGHPGSACHILGTSEIIPPKIALKNCEKNSSTDVPLCVIKAAPKWAQCCSSRPPGLPLKALTYAAIPGPKFKKS